MSQWPVEARSLACPDAEIRHCWLCSASYLFNFFDDSYQANYLKIYQTDLCQIFRVGRTVAVDDQSQISFFCPSRDIAMATIFVHSINIFFMPVAGRTAGQAKFGLWPASS